MNPIAGYEDKEGNVKPSFLISALEQEQISKEEMDQYLAEYATQHEIPDTISHALQSTDSQDNIYSLMLESELQNLIQYVRDSVTRNLSDIALKAELISMTNKLQNIPAREQIMAILNWLLQKYLSNKKLIADNIDAITKHQTTAGILTGSLREKDAEIFKLDSELQAKTRKLEYALGTIGELKSIEKPIEPITNNNILDDLRAQVAKAHGERDTIAQELQGENQNLRAKIIDLEKAQVTSNALGNGINAAGNPRQIPFITKVESIVNAVQKGNKDYKLEVRSPFQELYIKLNQHKGTLSDICEFTYVASFFIKKIFSRDPNLYDSLNTVIDTYLKQNPDVLDSTINAMFNLLEASENQTITGVGYYVIPNAENMKQLQVLETINLESDIINACNNAFNASFRIYNKNNTKFIVPNGFIIGPVRTGSIDKYELNGDNFVKKGAVENKFSKGFSYQTFLILYTLFIKSSLLLNGKNDPACPKSSILTNSKYFSNRDIQKRVRVQPVVAPAPQNPVII